MGVDILLPHLSSGQSTLALLPTEPPLPPRPPSSTPLKCLQPARPDSRLRNTEPAGDELGGAKGRAMPPLLEEGKQPQPSAASLGPALVLVSSSSTWSPDSSASDAATSMAVGDVSGGAR